MKTPRDLWNLTCRLALPVLVMTMTPPVAALAEQDDYSLQQDVAEQEGAVFGRLRFIGGTVTLRRDNQITTDLVVNDPLAPGDVFATERDGRAEAQLADGSSLKLDYDTELVLQSLSDSTNQIENTTILQLGRGSMIIRADNMDSKEKRFQIDTDGASVFLLSDGLFRIDVRSDGSTVVTSRRGVAEVMSQEISSLVRSGERITVLPDQIPGEARVFNTRLADDFDGWAQVRDEALLRRDRYDDEEPTSLPEAVEPYGTELSYYGRWSNTPSYGWVWRPVGLGPDWQPYVNGRWTDCRTGLVWVSYEPWGWAPFHYGRWEFLLGSGWVWIPGHVFSGAYVAWGVAPGYFGWCPLGYYDTPVAFSVNIGIHRDPWVYVGAQNIYARRINTVVVRDATVLRGIENRRVIVRGRPFIDPRRVKDAPRISQELYTVAENRRDVRMDTTPDARRLPFRENERQKLVQINNRRVRENRDGDVSRGAAVGRGPNGRPVTVMPSDRRINVPRNSAPPAGNPRGNGRERVRTLVPDDGRQPSEPGQNPGQRRNDPRTRGDSQPERVIPRIIPRPGSGEETERREGHAPPPRVRREDTQGQRPSGPPPGAQSRPPERPRSNAGGGNAGNGEGQRQRQQQKPRQQQNNGGGGGGNSEKHRHHN